MTLDEFMEALVKPNPEAEGADDYEALAFDAGIEYAVKKIKEFLAAETKEQKVTLSKYIEILSALSDYRKDAEFEDRDISWEESGYQLALNDIKRYIMKDETFVNSILEEYQGLDD